MAGKKKPFETAVFTDAHPADYRGRWAVFLFTLLTLMVAYWICRDFVFTNMLHRFAQREFNKLAGAKIEKLGQVTVDRQGDVTIHDGEAWTFHEGKHRLFFKARRVRLTLDGMPLRDDPLHLMRVDLDQPEIFIRREANAVWNMEWVFLKEGVRLPEAPRENPWKDYGAPDDDFPRNGVHIHEGVVHFTFITQSGKEVTWTATGVRGAIRKSGGIYRMDPFAGDFYGGRIKAHAEVPSLDPFVVRQMMVDIKDADVARMAAGSPFVTRPVSGVFNGVVALTYDPARTGSARPIASGHCEITDGNLWEFPAFAGILNLLCLTSVSDRRIDSAVLEFTVEQHRIRVDKMHFLGYPMSLFGDGECSLTGDWIEIVFVPRLGKSDWNSILPIIGAPIDLLGNIVKGLLMPVVLSGSFDNPKFEVDTGYPLQASTRTLIEEKSPR